METLLPHGGSRPLLVGRATLEDGVVRDSGGAGGGVIISQQHSQISSAPDDSRFFLTMDDLDVTIQMLMTLRAAIIEEQGGEDNGGQA